MQNLECIKSLLIDLVSLTQRDIHGYYVYNFLPSRETQTIDYFSNLSKMKRPFSAAVFL